MYRISKKDGNKSRVLSIQELTVNVKKLVRNSYTEVFINIDKNDDDQPLIVGRRISHAFHENEGITWYSGQVVSQVNIKHYNMFVLFQIRFFLKLSKIVVLTLS